MILRGAAFGALCFEGRESPRMERAQTPRHVAAAKTFSLSPLLVAQYQRLLGSWPETGIWEMVTPQRYPKQPHC